MTAKKGGLGRGLGRGLDAMISDTSKPRQAEKTPEKTLTVKEPEGEAKGKVFTVKIAQVEPSRKQPRKQFDEDALLELAESIKQFGVLQPLLVQKKDDYYEIIAGERRWRASKLAGIKDIPVIVKEFSEQEAVEISLIENIQRENLNPIDEATSISNIIKLRGYTQDEFANKFGKSRTYVTNILGLLKLPDEVKKLVEKRNLTMSHARVLSKMDDENKVIDLAKKVITDNLSVHDLEKLSQEEKNVKIKSYNKSNFDTKYRMYENIIMDSLNTKVRVHKNKIELFFDGIDELEDLLNKMNVKIEDE